MSEFEGSESLLVPGALRVYRHWRLGTDGLLRAVSQGIEWPPDKEFVARCLGTRPQPHSVPRQGCGCGVWAYYDPEEMGNQGFIFGAIEVTGRVLLGEKGVRAEKAKILALAPGDGAALKPWHSAEGAMAVLGLGKGWETALAARYEVPWFSERAELIEQFPPQDISALFPQVVPESLVYTAVHRRDQVTFEVELYSTRRIRVAQTWSAPWGIETRVHNLFAPVLAPDVPELRLAFIVPSDRHFAEVFTTNPDSAGLLADYTITIPIPKEWRRG